MKKGILLLVFFISLGFLQNVQAQEYKNAIGLRLGYPWALSFKTFISEKSALEFTGSYRGLSNIYTYFALAGYYQIHNPIASVSGLSWYYGAGAQVGFYSYNDKYSNPDNFAKTTIGISGVIGLDYKFTNAPINLSADWIPTFYIGGYNDGFGTGYGGLAVRYTF